MSTDRLVLVLCLIAGISSASDTADDQAKRDMLNEPFDLRAPRIEYTNEVFYASGGVTGRLSNATVRADRISGSARTGDLHIEGNVVFERENVVWQGSELDYNYITQTGDFGPSSLRADPYYLTVDRVERLSTNDFRLQGVRFTTCPKEDPHLHARAKEARLIDDRYLTAKGVALYAGGLPLLYVPYWRQNLGDRVFSLRGGYGSEWGAHLLINASVPVSAHIESSTDVNLYSKRGVGLGQGIFWDYPSVSGEVSGFYLKDEDPYSRYDSDSDKELIDEERYRFKAEHLQYFSDTHYLNTRASYLSDPVVTKEFLKKEFDQSAQPENHASWTYADRHVGSELFGNYRLNDFYGNIDRAEYSADLYRTRVPGTPLYFQSENSMAHLERVYPFSDTNNYDSVRLDSANTVYMPQRWGFLSLVPRAGYRATYYSKEASEEEELRRISSAGMEVSFHAAKVLSDRERWYGKGLRHKIEPYADYIYQHSSVTTNQLPQFDDVDRLSDEDKVKIGLRNVLQTKRAGRTARFVDLDLYTHYLVDADDAPDRFDALYVDLRMPLSKRSIFDVMGRWDWNEDTVPFLNTRYSRRHENLTIRLEHLYREQRDSLWTSRFELFPDQKWSAEGYVRYDDNDNDLEEVAVTGYINWCCMRYGLGYRYYDDGEHRLVVSFDLSDTPKSIGGRFF